MNLYMRGFEMNKMKQDITQKINTIVEINDIDINSTNEKTKKVILHTGDNKNYLVDREILKCSKLLIELLDGNDDDENIKIIPVVIHSRVIPYIICYMEHHHNKSTDEIEKPIVDNFMDISSISNWDKYYVCNIIDENEQINDLFMECLNASNFLSISNLCNLLCARFACTIGLTDMTTDKLRKIFNEQNDFTEEEEKKIADELNFIENSYSDSLNKNMFCSKNNNNEIDKSSDNESNNNHNYNDVSNDDSNNDSNNEEEYDDDETDNGSNSDDYSDNESNTSND